MKFVPSYRRAWDALVAEYGLARTLAGARKVRARGGLVNRSSSRWVGLYRELARLAFNWRLPGGAVDPYDLDDFGAPPHDNQVLDHGQWAAPSHALRPHVDWGGSGAPAPVPTEDEFHPWGTWISADIDLSQPDSEILEAIRFERQRRGIRPSKRPARAAAAWDTCVGPGFHLLRLREQNPTARLEDLARDVLGESAGPEDLRRTARRCMCRASEWIERVEHEASCDSSHPDN